VSPERLPDEVRRHVVQLGTPQPVVEAPSRQLAPAKQFTELGGKDARAQEHLSAASPAVQAPQATDTAGQAETHPGVDGGNDLEGKPRGDAMTPPCQGSASPLQSEGSLVVFIPTSFEDCVSQ
jgi:hypothetical protein